MDIRTAGHLIAERRRARGLTLRELAAAAGVGRSTLAALEAGKLGELGFAKILRICAAIDLVIEIRPPELDTPLMAHRHLTDAAGRELTRTAIDDVVTRGDFSAWRGLVRTMRADTTGRIARRVRDVVAALDPDDSKARAFSTLMQDLMRERDPDGAKHA